MNARYMSFKKGKITGFQSVYPPCYMFREMDHVDLRYILYVRHLWDPFSHSLGKWNMWDAGTPCMSTTSGIHSSILRVCGPRGTQVCPVCAPPLGSTLTHLAGQQCNIAQYMMLDRRVFIWGTRMIPEPLPQQE